MTEMLHFIKHCSQLFTKDWRVRLLLKVIFSLGFMAYSYADNVHLYLAMPAVKI